MLKVFEAFAGIGTQRMALRNLKIDHEVVVIAEIDKYAIKSYEAIHGKTHNVGDISKLAAEDIPEHDLFTYSFPCQDISIAGKQGGLEKGSDTRSSLLWECNRVIESKKPKYLMLENVKNLVGKKFKPSFDEWLEHLESLGYTNYWQVLNSKDYGVPQNRERVFVISILGEHEPYVFPEKFELTSRLRDVLEENVDEKFYLSEEKTEKLTLNMDRQPKLVDTNIIGHLNTSNYEQSDRVYNIDKEAPTITARDYKGAKQILEPKIIDDQGRTKKKLKLKDYAPTLRAQSHGNEPKVVEGIPIKNATNKGYLLAEDGDGVDLAYPDSKTRRGRVQKQRSQTVTTSDNLGVVEPRAVKLQNSNMKGRRIKEPGEPMFTVAAHDRNAVTVGERVVEPELKFVGGLNSGKKWLDDGKNLSRNYKQGNRVYDSEGISTSLTAQGVGGSGGATGLYKTNNFRIRKLTPKECWRLMGCSDEDFHKAEEVNSATQLYKQAGNAIVVSVLEAIFRNVFLDVPDEDLIGGHIPLF